jgi:hypothetical protein
MAFNTCPLFSAKPEAYDNYWNLIPDNEHNYSKYKTDLPLRNRVLANFRNCEEPTTVTLRYLLGHEKLIVDRIVERADTVSGKRLFIYGYWKHKNFATQQVWTMDIRENTQLTNRDRILSLFSSCNSS